MGYKITQIIMINNVVHRLQISLQIVCGSSNFCVKWWKVYRGWRWGGNKIGHYIDLLFFHRKKACNTERKTADFCISLPMQWGARSGNPGGQEAGFGQQPIKAYI